MQVGTTPCNPNNAGILPVRSSIIFFSLVVEILLPWGLPTGRWDKSACNFCAWLGWASAQETSCHCACTSLQFPQNGDSQKYGQVGAVGARNWQVIPSATPPPHTRLVLDVLGKQNPNSSKVHFLALHVISRDNRSNYSAQSFMSSFPLCGVNMCQPILSPKKQISHSEIIPYIHHWIHHHHHPPWLRAKCGIELICYTPMKNMHYKSMHISPWTLSYPLYPLSFPQWHWLWYDMIWCDMIWYEFILN